MNAGVELFFLDIGLPGQFYRLLLHARSCESVRIFNFDEAKIVVSELVKAEMERLRRDCVLSWKHPITQDESIKVCLLNIVPWSLHIQHILSDKYYIIYSHVMCFTETHTNESRFQRIEKYHPDWRSIHHLSVQHGHAICYNTKKVPYYPG